MGFLDFVSSAAGSVVSATQSVVSNAKDGANYVVNPLENLVGIEPGKTVGFFTTPPYQHFIDPMEKLQNGLQGVLEDPSKIRGFWPGGK